MKNLYLFYSRTNRTEAVILKMKELMGGDERVLRVKPLRDYGGPVGFIRALGSMFRKKPIKLQQNDPVDFADYDRVIIATPVWGGRVSSPVRAFLIEHKGAKRTAYIAVEGGSDPCEAVFDQLDELTGCRRDAAVVIEGMNHEYEKTLETLARQLQG